MSEITTIEELRNELCKIETELGIVSDVRIPLRDRVAHVIHVSDYVRSAIGIYRLRNLENTCSALTNTDVYKLRRNGIGQFTGGYKTIDGINVC